MYLILIAANEHRSIVIVKKRHRLPTSTWSLIGFTFKSFIDIASSIFSLITDSDNVNRDRISVVLIKDERGEVALFADAKTELDDKFDSPFEEAVCRGLRKAGYTVKTQVGCSGYRIDMAIRDEKNPGEFLLGIECDGRTYHSSATARDRDRLREEVLRKLEWKIYRIWSTDWFKNPQRELDRLIKYIEDLKISKELNKS